MIVAGIVVGGIEYFFGAGVQRTLSGQTPFGQPLKILHVGTTQLPEDFREELLAELSER